MNPIFNKIFKVLHKRKVYCPKCGYKQSVREGRRQVVCRKCKFKFYINK